VSARGISRAVFFEEPNSEYYVKLMPTLFFEVVTEEEKMQAIDIFVACPEIFSEDAKPV
jgi:hypothetical protein